MPRKLKTFVTSSGFFDLAVAAPSMKAALEILGIGKNAFRQGFAKETSDADVVEATMEHPGIVLRRPVGSQAAFKEQAELPKLSQLQRAIGQKSSPLPAKKKSKKEKPTKSGRANTVASLADARAAKRAAKEYEKEQARREREEEKKDAAYQKERERRDAEIRRAEAELEEAQNRHDMAMNEIAREREALGRREETEEQRWQKEKAKLQSIRDRI